MIDIDGSAHCGSGTIVRHAAAYAALTGQPVRVRNARARRQPPGLRPQHLRAIQAIRDLVGGSLDGAEVGSRSFEFRPGNAEPAGRYAWDITEHTETVGWLAWLFFRAEVRAAGSTLVVHGRDACRSTCARRQGLVQSAQAGAVASPLGCR